MEEKPIEVVVWKGDNNLVSIDPNCIRLLVYLRFAKVPATINYQRNPYWFNINNFPLFTNGSYNFTQFSWIIEHLRFMRYSLDFGLSTKSCSEMLAFISLSIKFLEPILEYVLWVDQRNFEEFTRPWYTKTMPFIFNTMYIRKRRKFANDLLEIYFPNTETHNVLQSYIKTSAIECFTILSNRLGDSDYFYGNAPSSLDCTVYAYLAPLVNLALPSKEISNILETWPNLVKYVKRIDERYFQDVPKVPVVQTKLKEDEDPEAASVKLKVFMAVFVACAMIGYAVNNNIVTVPKYQNIHSILTKLYPYKLYK